LIVKLKYIRQDKLLFRALTGSHIYMSLMAKLERDTLQRKCQKEIEELHEVFVSWFQRKLPKDTLEQDLTIRLASDFSHVAPNGQFLKGRQVLIGHLQDKYGCYHDRAFHIDIHNVNLLWTDDNRVLCTYEEWQSWTQDNEDIQFGRLSTCLLDTCTTGTPDTNGKLQWVHVHETWLEAESPPRSESVGRALSTMDDSETVMTGPQPQPGGTVASDEGFSDGGAALPMSNKKVIFLHSTATLNREHKENQRVGLDYMEASGVKFESVDAGNLKNRDQRDQLFSISGERGVFPQVFIETDLAVTYWGGWNQISAAHSNGTLASELGGSSGAHPKTLMAALGVSEAQMELMKANGALKTPKSSFTAASSVSNGGAVAAKPKDGGQPKTLMTALGVSEYELSKIQEKAVAEQSAKPSAVPTPQDASTKIEPVQLPRSNGSQEVVQLSKNYQEKMGASPIAKDVSSKRHVSPLIQQYAKPLTWENALVGISVAGFDIGTSQGPIGDEAWYRDQGEKLEELAQSRSIPRPKRKLCLPEMVFPTAHVAIEGHGIWMSWDCLDALEAWASAHHEIAIHSRISHNGVSVMRAKDAKLWESKRKHGHSDDKASAVFHYDWTFSTPFSGKTEGGVWTELDESGMRLSLLTDTSVPILFFDEIMLFEDDLHDNGQVQYSIKLRVMPSCAYILGRLWVRVDNVILRTRETRVLLDFMAAKPLVYRDITWRECMWNNLEEHNLPTDVKAWHHEGPETPAWNSQLRSLPEVSIPKGIHQFARLDYGNRGTVDT
jgi:glutaredoxin